MAGGWGIRHGSAILTGVRRRTFVGASLGLVGCAAAPRAEAPRTWAARKAAYATRLRERGPSPGKWAPQTPPDDVQEVRYVSAGRELLAWYAAPPGAAGAPGLVYFHGEFSFAAWDFAQVRPFLAAGFAVMTPALRGENGNPGDFELLYGEVDDGAAAVRWLASRPGVDARRIYTLGHSAGGGVSALLALVPDLPLAVTASVGGIYTPQTFGRWARYEGQRQLVRFDPALADEAELRALAANLPDMRRPHRAYVGREDAAILDNARAAAAEARRIGAPFTLTEIAGDHEKSLRPGVAAYLKDLTEGAGPSQAAEASRRTRRTCPKGQALHRPPRLTAAASTVARVTSTANAGVRSETSSGPAMQW